MVHEQLVMVREQLVIVREQLVIVHEQLVIVREQDARTTRYRNREYRFEQLVIVREQLVIVREQLVIVREQLVIVREQDARTTRYRRGVSLQDLRDILQDSTVQQQVIWLDCCFSGELLNFKDADLGGKGLECDRFLLAASHSSQLAYEHPDGKHGVLSGALLTGLDPATNLRRDTLYRA